MGTRLRSSTRASTAASESLAETMTEIKAKGETRKTSSARPLRGSELAKLTRIATFAGFASILIQAGVVYLVMNDIVKLYPDSIKLESLKGFSSRAEFALRYQSLLFGWLIFNIHAVMYTRLTTKALNPLVESTEKHAQKQKNILTNSFEQILISSLLQLIFVSFAGHIYTLKLIPAINIIQFIGRIAFFVGYPLYRTFGFSLTLLPNTLLVGYNLYKLGSYMSFY